MSISRCKEAFRLILALGFCLEVPFCSKDRLFLVVTNFLTFFYSDAILVSKEEDKSIKMNFSFSENTVDLVTKLAASKN